MQGSSHMKPVCKTSPPGRIKIMTSFSTLMETKNFQSITIAEIAKNAGVTEGLIYKYFKDKKDLLYQVLHQHFAGFLSHVQERTAAENSCMEKLGAIVLASLESYNQNRVFARILLLEVRNSPAYFDSCAYAMVKNYSRLIRKIVCDGIAKNELKPDTDPFLLQKVILGAIEHTCLKQVIFDRELDVQAASSGIINIVSYGVKK